MVILACSHLIPPSSAQQTISIEVKETAKITSSDKLTFDLPPQGKNGDGSLLSIPNSLKPATTGTSSSTGSSSESTLATVFETSSYDVLAITSADQVLRVKVLSISSEHVKSLSLVSVGVRTKIPSSSVPGSAVGDDPFEKPRELRLIHKGKPVSTGTHPSHPGTTSPLPFAENLSGANKDGLPMVYRATIDRSEPISSPLQITLSYTITDQSL
jgi:hypothetical protein